MKEDFNLLANFIKTESGNKRIYYMANPGNWGDGLIRVGTTEFFNKQNIPYTELFKKPISWIRPFLTGGTFIYGGGGAWCKYWNTGSKYVSLFSKRMTTIVLPSTYETQYKISNTHFFSRDKFESIRAMPSAQFCHDMAFFCTLKKSNPGDGDGLFFRNDLERDSRHDIIKGNVDFSRKGTHLTPIGPFLNEIGKKHRIFTDRLHIAIASSLLGKETHLYSNNYFKIKAIYKSSLQDNFPNCIYHDSPFKKVNNSY